MKKYILTLTLMLGALAHANYQDCYRQVAYSRGVDANDAARYCQSDNSPEFVRCYLSLFNSRGVDGSYAARVCLQNKSSKFVNCYLDLFGPMMSGQDAVRNCFQQR